MIRASLAAVLLVLAGCAPRLDAVWIASPPAVVAAMLEVAQVGPGDVVYDLGCGEGEIVIAAAQRGARAVGVDLDPERIANARVNVTRAGVTDRVTLLAQDLFATAVSPATVVTLYLGPEVNRRLRPKLLRELRPGTRIVSHDFSLGDWPPERAVPVPQVPGHRVLLCCRGTIDVPAAVLRHPRASRADRGACAAQSI